MAKQSRSNGQYRAYYGTDYNAALQPEYVYEPQKKSGTSEALKKRNHERAQYKAEVKRYAAMAVLMVAVACMGIVVVSRNAQIYRNNVIIRQLVQQKEEMAIKMDTDVMNYSAAGDLNEYFETAQTQLMLTYPEEDQVVTVKVTVPETEEQTQSIPQNKFDSVLDWISSFVGRIQDWA